MTITIPAYDEVDWSRIQAALGAQALYRAALLAGDMPHEIVDVFAGLDRPLFPSELDMRCTCPDWSIPCKHASAVLYVLAEAFDDDPFLVLAWRGRGRAALLDALRGMPEPLPAPDPSPSRRCRWSPGSADFYYAGTVAEPAAGASGAGERRRRSCCCARWTPRRFASGISR